LTSCCYTICLLLRHTQDEFCIRKWILNHFLLCESLEGTKFEFRLGNCTRKVS
jgi:hypothetical protein